jgi:hypothetical protein
LISEEDAFAMDVVDCLGSVRVCIVPSAAEADLALSSVIFIAQSIHTTGSVVS